MKIAFQDQYEWKNNQHAELELGLRMKKACDNIGIDSVFTAEPSVIEKFSPDIVFPLHHYTPKMFDAYTIGCMWNPVEYLEFEYSVIEKHAFENIKSYDAFAISSWNIKNYLDTLCFKSPHIRPQFKLYTSSCRTDYIPVKSFREITYVGANWQGNRHKDLFLNCDKIGVYGPADAWKYLQESTTNYRGELPFGNGAVFNTYRKNGIGLCFHSQAHLTENVPNMRVFEMAASGSIILADNLPFIRDNFGDSVLYIDTSRSTNEIIEQIESQYNWIQSHKKQAHEMAKSANEIFNNNFCLEKLFTDIVDQYSNNCAAPKTPSKSSVEIIMRTDGSRRTITKSIKSITNQTHKNLSLTFIYWGNNKQEFFNYLKRVIPSDFTFRVLEAKGRKDRSYNLYYGLRKADSDYVGFCDDDDILFHDHISSLLEILEKNDDYSLAYAGSIIQRSKKGSSSRDLAYFHDFINFDRESYITSNSYLIKRKDLPQNILTNEIPVLAIAEDRILLDAIFLSGRKFLFGEKVTNLFLRNEDLCDNISFNRILWEKEESLYKAFLKKSSRLTRYVEIEEEIQYVVENNDSRSGSRLVNILRVLLRKGVPLRIRKYVLLMIKELIKSSSNV